MTAKARSDELRRVPRPADRQVIREPFETPSPSRSGGAPSLNVSRTRYCRTPRPLYSVSESGCTGPDQGRVSLMQSAISRAGIASLLQGRSKSWTNGKGGMTEAKQPAVFVDGNNVMGSRADGWWRNRAEAAERLVAEIAPLARDSEAAWTIVFDGPGPPGMAPPRECLTVVHTGHRRRNGADDRIVELVDALPDRKAVFGLHLRCGASCPGARTGRGGCRCPDASGRIRRGARRSGAERQRRPACPPVDGIGRSRAWMAPASDRAASGFTGSAASAARDRTHAIRE